MPLGSTVVVPVASPASVRVLATVAATIAAADRGRVVPVTVVPLRATDDQRRGAREVVMAVEAVAARHGVSATGLIVEAGDVPMGLQSVVAAHDASLVVMGWQGPARGDNVFGRLIDAVVGRSKVPLVIVRGASAPPAGVVLALTEDHLAPSGARGVSLAGEVAGRLRGKWRGDLTLVEAGTISDGAPEEVLTLVDRRHHDPRGLHDAVTAASRPGDAVIVAVAPTLRGLRDAATNLTEAAEDAYVLVAVDVGPRREPLAAAGFAPRRRAGRPTGVPRTHGIMITVAAGDGQSVSRRRLRRSLEALGDVGRVEVWWEVAGNRQFLRTTVRILADGANQAIGRVMGHLHEDEALRGCALQYDLVEDEIIPILDDLAPLGAIED